MSVWMDMLSEPAAAIPLADLGLSVRAWNVLEWRGCVSASDVAKLTAGDLLSEANFGKVSLADVRQALARQGMKLRGDA